MIYTEYQYYTIIEFTKADLDCLAAYTMAIQNIDKPFLDDGRLMIGGDSIMAYNPQDYGYVPESVIDVLRHRDIIHFFDESTARCNVIPTHDENYPKVDKDVVQWYIQFGNYVRIKNPDILKNE